MADNDRVSPQDRRASAPKGVYAVIAILAVAVIALLVMRPATESTGTTDQAATGTGVASTAVQQVEQIGFTLEQPRGWTALSQVELVKFQDYFAYAARRSEPDALVSVRVQESETSDVNIDELGGSLDTAMADKFVDFNKISEEKIQVHGNDALRYEYTFTSERQEKVREQIVIILADQKVFHIAAWAADKDFEQIRADLDSFVDSFSVKN